ncbi:tetratricopeptide repeat protein [Actinospica durhamensis]|uniref:Tetratricopeptide repeat protein n=1 Tax=Actinospica durhamensis TaxID=1508375 RepID=A0A941EW38_9ACTN|nr:BTAD domain-containing putative transcriptional regulator [Actinospica durhamensis]MBR7836079.1 tetratricopeptide repeat protein [Actinospica durhamensis]
MRFCLLGSILIDDGAGERPITAARQRALAAALLLRANRVVEWDEAARLVWEGEPPEGARATLHGYVSRLRRALGPSAAERIQTRDCGYLAVVRAGELDLDEFEQLRTRGKSAAREERWEESRRDLAQALALWRGTPLLDVTCLAGREDVVRQWTEIRLQTLEARLAADLELGLHQVVLAELTGLAREHPLRERFTGQLMLALYRCDRQAEALAVYRDAWKTLVEEIGVEPGALLKDLNQRILDRDPALAPSQGRPSVQVPAVRTPPPPAQLPPVTADFSGRGPQTAALLEFLEPAGPAEASRLAAVTGPGGIGKTTLAVHVAHRLSRFFPDGQLFAELAGAGPEPVAPQEIQGRFLRALGFPPEAIPADDEERTALYRSALAGRRVLVVLDNASSCSAIRDLLPGTGPAAVIVTSRAALSDAAVGRAVNLDLLSAATARLFFEQLIGAARAGAEPGSVEEVVEACGGLPLALRIAGARLAARPHWSVRSLADLLTDARGRLGELSVGELSVRACFQVGYDGLRGPGLPWSDRADHYFRLLGLVDLPTISGQAAAALFDVPPAWAHGLLERFTDARLLESPGCDRYGFHDLTRLFARELGLVQESPAERTAALGRLFSWYLASAEAAALALRPDIAPVVPRPEEGRARGGAEPAVPADRAAALAWFESERANLVAAALQAHELGMWDLAWRIPEAMRTFFIVRRHWADWIRTYGTGIDAARECGDLLGEARMHDGLGVAYFDVHRFAESAEVTQTAVAVYRAAGRRDLEALAASNLTGALGRLGRYPEGMAAARAALEIQLADGQLNAAATTWGNLGMLQFFSGDAAAAIESYLVALDLSRRTGNRYAEVAVLSNLGEAYTAVGRHVAAIEHCHQALILCAELGTDHGRAITLAHLAEAYWQTGSAGQAREAWQEAAGIYERLGAPEAAEIQGRLRQTESV